MRCRWLLLPPRWLVVPLGLTTTHSFFCLSVSSILNDHSDQFALVSFSNFWPFTDSPSSSAMPRLL
jgi:hypothetical protein